MTDPNDPAFDKVQREFSAETGDIHRMWYSGLTKRELFSAMAMQGFCSYESKETTIMGIDDWEKKWAKTACRIADALITELSKEPTKGT